ncbi:type II toxin-antitoxin system RelE/ParE family toxin [Bosea sp. (in: a-proteobacteria)]|jgi:hypothetical protein|uniref:type II toxin-antitoxin system RelE/ParE family toxin n=1 Tax=Bosea sp. (in: a-proteobacteria) TaxID=1871050 RepID=UPI00260EFA34|nr:type II toxin-antitoxin system RelE/ParE family toxin [Bosea sp. (in: a-proteobacteria)]MCO5089884.1 type II toxin-antitoxin system RelE/ParE family toxin [Bosea sp. (in: a-proteobacteria)]
MHSVLLTSVFERQAKAAGLDDDEIQEIAATIASDPRGGELMVGTGGARKMRHAGRGEGKSGGYRTIHYFGGDDVPLFLLALIDKGKRANLSKAERNDLAKVLPRIAETYRAQAKTGGQ